MRMVQKIIFYCVLSFLSLLFFVYLMFPFRLLKENMISQITQQTGLGVSVKKLDLALPLGVILDELVLTTVNGKSYKLDEVELSLGILPLFIGNVSVNLYCLRKGDLSVTLTYSFWQLLKMSSQPLPSTVTIHSKAFPVGELIGLILSHFAEQPTSSILLKPVLEKLTIDGTLDTDTSLKLGGGEFQNASGSIFLNLKGLNLAFDPSMQVAPQQFEKALIKADIQQGGLVLDKSSEFSAKELSAKFEGGIKSDPQKNSSNYDARIIIELSGGLKDQFSVILDAMAETATDGKLLIRLIGPITDAPVPHFEKMTIETATGHENAP